jgi:hypothetical protein
MEEDLRKLHPADLKKFYYDFKREMIEKLDVRAKNPMEFTQYFPDPMQKITLDTPDLEKSWYAVDFFKVPLSMIKDMTKQTSSPFEKERGLIESDLFEARKEFGDKIFNEYFPGVRGTTDYWQKISDWSHMERKKTEPNFLYEYVGRAVLANQIRQLRQSVKDNNFDIFDLMLRGTNEEPSTEMQYWKFYEGKHGKQSPPPITKRILPPITKSTPLPITQPDIQRILISGTNPTERNWRALQDAAERRRNVTNTKDVKKTSLSEWIAESKGGLSGTLLNTLFKFPVTKIPSFDIGTDRVAKTGLALIHEGERITPAEGDKPSVRTTAKNLNLEMQQEQAGSEPRVTEIVGEDIADVAKNTEHLDILPAILSTLKEIKEALRLEIPTTEGPTGEGVSGPGESRVGRRPSMTYPLQVGLFKQGSSMRTQNIGQY